MVVLRGLPGTAMFLHLSRSLVALCLAVLSPHLLAFRGACLLSCLSGSFFPPTLWPWLILPCPWSFLLSPWLLLPHLAQFILVLSCIHFSLIHSFSGILLHKMLTFLSEYQSISSVKLFLPLIDQGKRDANERKMGATKGCSLLVG